VATTFSELLRRVYLGFPRTDGEAILVIKQAMNDAIQAIASLEDSKSLLVTDTTTADTVDGQKAYHLTTHLLLTRPKDIYSIRLEDTSNSRKLIYVPHNEVDTTIPYPEQNSEGVPKWYTEFGDYIELIPIPDAAYDLYIRYSQWPDVLSADTDESPYGTSWDHVIVFLTKDIANAYLNGDYVSPAQKAIDYLKLGIKAQNKNPDHILVARPFDPEGRTVISNYWEDPFTKGVR
jgi:hypothetical protein